MELGCWSIFLDLGYLLIPAAYLLLLPGGISTTWDPPVERMLKGKFWYN